MEQIAFQTIQKSIDNICGITAEEELDAISQALFDVQPALAGFVVEFIEDMSEEAKDLGFMMALILWKSFEEKYPNLRTITEDEVVAKFEEQEVDLERLLQLNEEILEEIQKNEMLNGQPEVLNYVIQELFAADEEEVTLDEDEELHLFMVLKFFSNCLNDVAKEVTESVKH
ncbi:MAG TPA: hypothetical protein VIG33_18505 [Pseudobdellovibrionaceae bacterium]|jgi:hypothetical protein